MQSEQDSQKQASLEPPKRMQRFVTGAMYRTNDTVPFTYAYVYDMNR